MFICKICKNKRYFKKRILYPVCDNCKNETETMPPFRRTDSRRNYLGDLPCGSAVYRVEYDIDDEIDMLEQEIYHLKTLITKKYERVADLKKKKALQEQENRHKKELQEMKIRVRRETMFLIRNISNDSDSDGDLAKSANEHLNDEISKLN